MRHALWIMLLALAGCGDSGRLLITLDRPSGALDPMSDRRLSRFSLRIAIDGQVTDQDTVVGRGGELSLGDVPVDTAIDLRLAGKSSTGLMLGLGQVLDLQVASSGETKVSVKLRKPLGYVAGPDQVLILDAAAEGAAKLELSPIKVSQAVDVAAAANGVLMLVLSGNSVVPLRTSDHAKLPSVPLSSPGTALAAGPNNRYGVVCHAAQKKVGVVDLRRVGTGNATERTVAVPGVPSRVVFGSRPDRAWVLLDGHAQGDSCSAKRSSLVEVNLAAGTVGAPRTLNARVADVALDPRDEALLLAMPCSNRLRRVHNAKNQDTTVPQAYDLALADRNLVVIGRASGTTVRGQAVLFDLTGGGGLGTRQSVSFTYPAIEVAFRSNATPSGYFKWVSEPTSLAIYDVAVTPDSQRAVCLARGAFASNMTLGNCTFRAKLDGVAYFLLDLTTGGMLVRRFTRLKITDCYANCLADAQGNSWNTFSRCSSEFARVLQSAKQLVAGAGFEPGGTTLLFGGS